MGWKRLGRFGKWKEWFGRAEKGGKGRKVWEGKKGVRRDGKWHEGNGVKGWDEKGWDGVGMRMGKEWVRGEGRVRKDGEKWEVEEMGGNGWEREGRKGKERE